MAIVGAACAPGPEVAPPARPGPAAAPQAPIWAEAPANWQAATPTAGVAPPGALPARAATPAAGAALAVATTRPAPEPTDQPRRGERPIHDLMDQLAPPTPVRATRVPLPPLLPPRAVAVATAVPSPIPTRYAWTAPAVRNGSNKWGVGVYKESNRVAELLRETRPGVILLMDPSPGWAERVRKDHPTAFIVGRRFKPEDQQPLDQPELQGIQFADWVAELALPLRGTVDAWMSYNEVLGSPPSGHYDLYNRFMVAFARRLQGTYGVAAVASNDGPGAVEPEDYPRYFADAIRESEFFGLHAYAPPGDASLRREAESFTLRYRRINTALERAGIRGKRMVITETGVGDGFRHGVGSDEQMAAGFAWLTEEMRKDQYMIGQAAFGLFDSTGAWKSYDLTDTAVIDVTPRLLGTRR